MCATWKWGEDIPGREMEVSSSTGKQERCEKKGQEMTSHFREAPVPKVNIGRNESIAKKGCPYPGMWRGWGGQGDKGMSYSLLSFS